jgi:protein regulator of cytokinesis 1
MQYVFHIQQGDRLLKVEKYLDAIHELCLVLGCDFFTVVQEVHPSLDESTNSGRDKSISNETIKGLESTIQSLRDEKRRRMQQVIL